MMTLHELFSRIDARLRNGLTLVSCEDLLTEYDINNNEWKHYVEFDKQHYTRVSLPNMTNDLFEFILICWDKNQTSQIHNHPKNGCLMKILKGELTEDIYVKKERDIYTYTMSRKNQKNAISYMNGDVIIHKISNTNNEENDNYQSISLHIYSPPKFKYSFVTDDKIKY
jgi:cysteine dioxygenase